MEHLYFITHLNKQQIPYLLGSADTIKFLTDNNCFSKNEGDAVLISTDVITNVTINTNTYTLTTSGPIELSGKYINSRRDSTGTTITNTGGLLCVNNTYEAIYVNSGYLSICDSVTIQHNGNNAIVLDDNNQNYEYPTGSLTISGPSSITSSKSCVELKRKFFINNDQWIPLFYERRSSCQKLKSVMVLLIYQILVFMGRNIVYTMLVVVIQQ